MLAHRVPPYLELALQSCGLVGGYLDKTALRQTSFGSSKATLLLSHAVLWVCRPHTDWAHGVQIFLILNDFLSRVSCQKLRAQCLELLVQCGAVCPVTGMTGPQRNGPPGQTGSLGVAHQKKGMVRAVTVHQPFSNVSSIHSLASVLPGRPWINTHPFHDSVCVCVCVRARTCAHTRSVMSESLGPHGL